MMFMFLQISCNYGDFGGTVTSSKPAFCRFYSSFLEKLNKDESLRKRLEIEDRTILTMEYLEQVDKIVNAAINIDPDFHSRVNNANERLRLSTYSALNEAPEFLRRFLANLHHYKEAIHIVFRERGVITTNQEEFSQEGVVVQLLVGIYHFNCSVADIEGGMSYGLGYLTKNFPIRSNTMAPVAIGDELAQALIYSRDGMLVQNGDKPGTSVVYMRLIQIESYGKIKKPTLTPLDIRKVHSSALDP
jgi:hypothetical protein